MTTSFRRDVTNNLVAMATDFQNAYPLLLLRVHARRPKGFTGDLPAVYVGSHNETLAPTVGRWSRQMEPQLVLVGNSTGAPEEIADEMDTLVDTFLDWANARPHAISSNTVAWPATVRDVELEIDDVVYPAAVVTFTALSAEGRG